MVHLTSPSTPVMEFSWENQLCDPFWCPCCQEANLLNILPEELKLQVRRSQARDGWLRFVGAGDD